MSGPKALQSAGDGNTNCLISVKELNRTSKTEKTGQANAKSQHCGIKRTTMQKEQITTTSVSRDE